MANMQVFLFTLYFTSGEIPLSPLQKTRGKLW